MRTHFPLRFALAAVAVILLLNQGGAAPREQLVKQLDTVADAVRKGDKESLPDLVKKAAKLERELEHWMELFHSEGKKGLSVGKVVGPMKVKNVEQLIDYLAHNDLADEDLKKSADALTEIAYRTAALAKISDAYAPKKDKDKKTKARWMVYTGSMYEGSLDLVQAVKDGSVANTRKAAIRINGNCSSCHKVFKEKEHDD